MGFELGRALLLSDAIAPDALASALHLVATQGIALPRALLALGAVDPARLDEELARADVPMVRHVVPLPELVARLPAGLCDALLAVPMRQDPRTGTVDVAVVDARDAHAADEIAYWLESPVRVLRASYAAMDAALRRMKGERGVVSLAAPIWVPMASSVRDVAETPMYGTPAAERPSANMPIPLTRRSPIPTAPETDRQPELDADPGPVLELRTRKSPPPEREPITRRGPFAPLAPPLPFEAPTEVLAAMRAAGDRDAIVSLLVQGARAVARKVAVFVVKKDGFAGWACSKELATPERVRATRLPLHGASVLAQALAAPAPYVTRIVRGDANAPLLALWGGSAPNEVAVSAVRIDGRPALVVLADEIGDTMLATARLDELARAAGEALARLVAQRKHG